MNNNIVNQRIFQNRQNTINLTKGKIEFNQKVEKLKTVGEDLASVKGIGPATLKILNENSIRTTEQLKVMSDEWLKNKLPHLSYMAVKLFLNKERIGVSEQ